MSMCYQHELPIQNHGTSLSLEKLFQDLNLIYGYSLGEAELDDTLNIFCENIIELLLQHFFLHYFLIFNFENISIHQLITYLRLVYFLQAPKFSNHSLENNYVLQISC